jgi:protoporphyrin/coproporphyrin ferrochelatase
MSTREVRTVQLKYWKNIPMIPIGFVSDHLEILIDIEIDAKEFAKEVGIHLEGTQSFNGSVDLMGILVSVGSSS